MSNNGPKPITTAFDQKKNENNTTRKLYTRDQMLALYNPAHNLDSSVIKVITKLGLHKNSL